MTTLLKCKMCGGTLEIQENETVARCKYCGSLMTIPRVDTEKKARMFNRANEYRINAEFDQAFEAYKAIASETPDEPEAYWGMVLSEYGIEYVEDPKTGKRIPTCHRTSPTSIKNSSNFKLAVQYADAEQKMMYEDEAKEIDQIQKRILAVSAKEDPYDVFICYKETNDITGERTTDSVLAQDIYNELTKQGIKTFFSRITLEDKLGVDYEPYIYAALRSAKVMLVVTEDPDNCEAVWVKNEWMRFLNFMKEDSSKTIIPVYQKITAYELPAELARFQSQDMSKIGAIQDLVRGVQKLIDFKETSEDQVLLKQLINEKKAAEERRRELALKEEEEKKKKKLLEEQRQKERLESKERRRRRFMKALPLLVVVVLVCIGALLYWFVIRPANIYKAANALLEAGRGEEAAQQFASIPSYKDSSDLAANHYYELGLKEVEANNREEAASFFLKADSLAKDNVLSAKIKYGLFKTYRSILTGYGDKIDQVFEELMTIPEDGDVITAIKNSASTSYMGFAYISPASSMKGDRIVWESSQNSNPGKKIGIFEPGKEYRCFYKSNNNKTIGIILENGSKGYVDIDPSYLERILEERKDAEKDLVLFE